MGEASPARSDAEAGPRQVIVDPEVLARWHIDVYRCDVCGRQIDGILHDTITTPDVFGIHRDCGGTYVFLHQLTPPQAPYEVRT